MSVSIIKSLFSLIERMTMTKEDADSHHRFNLLRLHKKKISGFFFFFFYWEASLHAFKDLCMWCTLVVKTLFVTLTLIKECNLPHLWIINVTCLNNNVALILATGQIICITKYSTDRALLWITLLVTLLNSCIIPKLARLGVTCKMFSVC